MAATITNLMTAQLGGNSPAALGLYTANAGDWLLLLLSASNDGSGGATSYSSTSVLSAGGGSVTITDRANILYDPGAAGAGANLIIVTVEVTANVTNGNLQVNWVGGTAPGEGVAQIYKIVPGAGEAVSFVAVDTTGSTGNATSYTAPTVSVTNGDTIFAAAAIETDDPVTGDSDTTNGNWSTIVTRLHDAGADASTMSCASQYKTVTATGDQSWACTTATGRDSARTYIILRSATSGVDLSLSKTLGTLTSSAAYTVDTNTASLSKTLGTLTVSSAYTVDTNTASLSKTLGAATLVAAYTVESELSLSKTLGALTSSAAYTVESNFDLSKTLGALSLSSAFTAEGGSVSADLANTLGALTVSAAYTVDTNTAALTKTLGALTSSAAFQQDTTASLSKTLGALTVVAAYTVDTNTASLSKTLGTLTLSAAFTGGVELALSQTLGNASLAATYTVDTNTASLTKTLGELTSAATLSVTGAAEEAEAPQGGHLWPDYHPPVGRKRKVREVEEDVREAYRIASGEQSAEAVMELKRAAATALSVAKREDDRELKALAEQIIALRRLDASIETYLARVGEILQRAEDDDLEAFGIMAMLA